MTKAERMRAEAIERYATNEEDCGRWGRVFELECARAKSNKTRVGTQGEVDVSIKVEINGKTFYRPTECKTNGGRVDGLMNGTSRVSYVVYRMDYTQKKKGGDEWREVPPVVLPVSVFLEMLKACGALKTMRHGGEVDGVGIQVSSKKFYLALCEYIAEYGESVLFDNEKTFDEAIFEAML